MHASAGNVIIEPATRNDLPSVIALHIECFTPSEHLGMLFGKKFIAACYDWFFSSGQGFILVARSENRIVGAISVSDRPYEAFIMRTCKKQVVCSFVRCPWLIFHPAILKRIIWSLKSRISQTTAQRVQGCAQEGFIMVSRDLRGQGLATRLRQEAMSHCILRGAACFFSYMKATNIASRRPYEKLGFTEVRELASRGFVCMRRDLQATNGSKRPTATINSVL